MLCHECTAKKPCKITTSSVSGRTLGFNLNGDDFRHETSSVAPHPFIELPYTFDTLGGWQIRNRR